MKFKKKWCGFFTGVAAVASAPFAIAAYFTKPCSQLSSHALDLIDTLLNSRVGGLGEVSVDLQLRNTSIHVPIDLKNVAVSFQLQFADELLDQLQKIPQEIEAGCDVVDWTTAATFSFYLLMLMAMSTGVVFLHKIANKETHQSELLEKLNNEQSLSIGIN